jgi:hypothetical protein
LAPDDLIETATGKAFVRIEFGDGTRLDLGPQTRVQLNFPARRKGDRPALYLLSGWIKLATDPTGSDATAATTRIAGAFASAPIDCSDLVGTVVAHLAGSDGAIFLEAGHARLLDRRARATTTTLSRAGEFISWSKEAPLAHAAYPTAGFVTALPPEFANSIDPRYARYASRDVAAAQLGRFTFDEVEAWIDAERSIRRQFVRTWRAKADEPDFRSALAANMSRHPEWDPILHPELYLPKSPSLPVAPPAPDALGQAAATQSTAAAPGGGVRIDASQSPPLPAGDARH